MKIIRNGIAYLLLLASADAAQDHAVYDLKCTGTVTSLKAGVSDEKPSEPVSYTMKLHVDLRQNTFCQDLCGVSERIWKILPANIIFRDATGPQLQRLWVTDDGQFSNTWLENQQGGDDKSQSLMSAQGGCEKSEYSAQPVPTGLKPTLPPKPALTAAQAPAPDAELNVAEISALVDIKNRRPVSAELHTRLHTLGYAHLKDELWVLTRKGEKIVSGN